MPRFIQVPGYDQPVEFPDGMADDQIAAVLRKQVGGAQSPAAPTPTPRPAAPTPAPDILTRVNRAINEAPGIKQLRGAGDKVTEATGDPVQWIDGASKGAQSTGASLGELMTRLSSIPKEGVGRALTGDYPAVAPFQNFKRAYTTPENTGENAGKKAEQIAEFFVPGSNAAKGSMALRMLTGAAENAGLATLQSGRVGDETKSGAAFGAAGPVVGKTMDVAGGALKSGAQKGLMKLLGVGKNDKAWNEGTRAVDQMLADGGLMGGMDKLARSRAALSKESQTALEQFRAGDASHLVDVMPVLQDLYQARQALITPGTVAHASKPGALAAVESKISDLQDLAQQFNGRQIPRDALEHVRASMDEVYKAASLPEKVGAASADKSYGDAIRRGLNADDLQRADLTTTASNRMLAEKLSRKAARQGNSPAMGEVRALGSGTQAAMSMLGGGLGAAHSPEAAVLGAAAGAAPFAIIKLVRSPAWRTTSATVKNQLGELLSRGDIQAASELATRAMASTSMGPVPTPTPESPRVR